MPVHPDAVPDRGTTRVQLLLAARPGATADLCAALVQGVDSATDRLDPGIRVSLLRQIPDDPFPGVNPGSRPMDAVVDLHGPSELVSIAAAREALSGAVDMLDGLIDAQTSGTVVGWAQAVIPGERRYLRYLYLMRRKPGLSHDDYLDHYFHRHSAFAFHLKAIGAYTQVHVDPGASEELARALGVASHDIDSVTELTFDTPEEFFAGVTPEAGGAGEDELTFVDRERSVSFCSVDLTIRASADE